MHHILAQYRFEVKFSFVCGGFSKKKVPSSTYFTSILFSGIRWKIEAIGSFFFKNLPPSNQNIPLNIYWTKNMVHFTPIMKSGSTIMFGFLALKITRVKKYFFGNRTLTNFYNTLKPILSKNMVHFTSLTKSWSTL